MASLPVPPDPSAVRMSASAAAEGVVPGDATVVRSAQPDAAAGTDPREDAAGPRHVAIIMDGNGRWAQRRHMPRLQGHRQGVDTIWRWSPFQVDIGNMDGYKLSAQRAIAEGR